MLPMAHFGYLIADNEHGWVEYCRAHLQTVEYIVNQEPLDNLKTELVCTCLSIILILRDYNWQT